MFKGFKIIYIIIILLSTLITIAFAFLTHRFKGIENLLSVTLGGIAIITSTVALGLSDKKQKTLKINLDFWKIRDSHSIAAENNAQVKLFAFEICNMCNEALNEFIVSIRLPDRNYYQSNQNLQNHRYFSFGESIIAQNDTLKYLGISKDDNYIRIEHYLKNIDNWNKGNIAVTISANNFTPKTFIIKPSEKQKILNSNNNNRIKMVSNN